MRRRFTNISSIKFNIVDYLTIESLEDGLEVYFSNDIEYGIDGVGWRKLTAFKTIKIDTGQTVSFRGNLKPSYTNGIGTFNVTKNFNLKGTAMSMLFGDEGKDNFSLIGHVRAFYTLFLNCSTLKSIASNFLPATTLANSCYDSMFFGCTSLTTAPELPATTLANSCYDSMFYSCSSLTTAPTLPATTLTDYCYRSMFSGCSSLTTAPTLPATTLANSCYDSMFYSCSSLTTAPTLPATKLAYGCYSYMFSNCSNLTTAPELPATTLAEWCYSSMFDGCTALTTAPELPATTLANYCYSHMLHGCKSLTTAPELPATTLVYYCYANMFYGCSKLNHIKMLATDISESGCLNNWVYGVASTGTFVKNPDMTTLPTGSSGIPSGWTVVDEINFSVEDLAEEYPTTQYKAEEGMTWEQFCNSKYNVDDWYIEDTIYSTYIIHQYGDKLYYKGSPVMSTDIILSNKAYTYSL